MARLIDRLIRNPEAEWEDVMVMPTHIVTRQSTDIYANNDPHIAEVLRYIHENISQKITVNELVKLVPLSRRLLETRFKKSMGTSIYDYIIQVRIEKMMQLLCEGQSVSEAAAELGFSDIKNVSRTFRQLKGITPSEYREQVAPKTVIGPAGRSQYPGARTPNASPSVFSAGFINYTANCHTRQPIRKSMHKKSSDPSKAAA